MLQIFANDFMNIGSTMAMVGVCLHNYESRGIKVDAEFCKEFKEILAHLKDDCDKLNLKVSSDLLEKAINDLPQGERELEQIIRAIKSEIKSNLFLYIPSHRAKYHEFVSKIISSIAFPNSSKELINAGNCYAIGEYTACVFHSMRAAELGLRALAKHLGVAFPFPIELADWHNIIDKVESEIKSMKQLPKGKEKDEELRFCSSAAAQFRYFKDAYRIFVAHARETYDEFKALTIMDHTLKFIENLSIKISE
jgi:HEPN domain-containing protein